MARARNIKPGLFKNEILGVADPLYTLLFEGLWLLADREGRLEDRPVRIKGELFPYRDGLDMNAMLSWLEREGFIRRYHANGLAVIQILQFGKHQTPHGTEKDSDLPDEKGLFIVHVRGNNGYSTGEFSLVDKSLTVKDSGENTLIPDSGFLIPDSGLGPSPATPSTTTKRPIPEDFCVSARVVDWAKRKGYSQLDEHLEAFVRKCQANGYKKADWDASFMEAIREDWAKLRPRAAGGVAPAGESKTTPMDPKAIYKPDPKLTAEQLAANRANAERTLDALRNKGLSALKEIH